MSGLILSVEDKGFMTLLNGKYGLTSSWLKNGRGVFSLKVNSAPFSGL